jgi:hypothetical protein
MLEMNGQEEAIVDEAQVIDEQCGEWLSLAKRDVR